VRKSLIPKGFVVVAALAFALSATAQQRTVVTISETASSFYTVGKVEVSYFAGSNTTEVRIDLPRHRSGENAASFWLVSTLLGKVRQNRKKYPSG
jgi:hypothetical protein